MTTLRESIARLLRAQSIDEAEYRWDDLSKDEQRLWLLHADAVLVLIEDKNPPSDMKLDSVYNGPADDWDGDAGESPPAGSFELRNVYDFGFARGSASSEQEITRLRRIEAEVNVLRKIADMSQHRQGPQTGAELEQRYALDEIRRGSGYVLAELQEEEQAVQRELGEWLAAAPRRYFSEFPPEVMAPIGAPRRYNWTIKLTENGTDMGIADRPDRTNAIRDALKKAKAP